MDVRLFPNPSPDGRLRMSLEGMDAEEELQVEVFDALGALEHAGRQVVLEGAQELAVPPLARGMHMVRLTLGASVRTVRVVVQ